MYDAEQNEPAWVQSISTPSSSLAGVGNRTDGGGGGGASSVVATSTAAQSPRLPQTALTPLLADTAIPGCPPSLTWYVFSVLGVMSVFFFGTN